ncbi:AbrB/MazE/SpoVT family DNA-binding domain-containing protein [Actinotignum sp. GS-2025e]|uniref:AbrB/MazE/SpoVT family DNA-binding domain-containing protein n=2 Tax=Actinotignum TaxID=1653174 RepID=UPI000F7DDAB5|nr:AbrB/MazE/SpoVT family DNA-binding domain-containing protein [Actinotignum sanguinis]MDY5148323.1 AbrB/MazE/SpoVT family DNA-binding domain-containing protein [Actinotignum sanguinis]RTE47878.1 AbrB/MazE/SpoVT family DNA-binding domain-containing protein [Actinotignum sanguinis]
MSTVFVESAKVMAKGQVTVPKSVRNRLGVDSGDRLVFVVDDDEVRVVNSARYAMSVLQAGLEGEAERLGLDTEEAVNALVADIRSE